MGHSLGFYIKVQGFEFLKHSLQDTCPKVRCSEIMFLLDPTVRLISQGIWAFAFIRSSSWLGLCGLGISSIKNSIPKPSPVKSGRGLWVQFCSSTNIFEPHFLEIEFCLGKIYVDGHLVSLLFLLENDVTLMTFVALCNIQGFKLI